MYALINLSEYTSKSLTINQINNQKPNRNFHWDSLNFFKICSAKLFSKRTQIWLTAPKQVLFLKLLVKISYIPLLGRQSISIWHCYKRNKKFYRYLKPLKIDWQVKILTKTTKNIFYHTVLRIKFVKSLRTFLVHVKLEFVRMSGGFLTLITK